MGSAKNLLSNKIPRIPLWLGRGAALHRQEGICHWRLITSGEVSNAWNDHQHQSWLTQPVSLGSLHSFPFALRSAEASRSRLHIVLELVLQYGLRSRRCCAGPGLLYFLGCWLGSRLLCSHRSPPPPSSPSTRDPVPDLVREAYLLNDRWALLLWLRGTRGKRIRSDDFSSLSPLESLQP